MKLTPPTRAQLDAYAALMYDDMLTGIAYEARVTHFHNTVNDKCLAHVGGTTTAVDEVVS